jgi:hypothetical protein
MLLWFFEEYLEKSVKVTDMHFLKFYPIVILFSLGGFVRSVGFMSAAHVCYPLLLDLLADWRFKSLFRILVTSALFLTPFFMIQVFVYRSYCGADLRPSFCEEKIPNYYDYIQKTYWDVKFLNFYFSGQLYQLLFVVVSLPVWIIFNLDFLKKSSIFKILTANIFDFLKFNSNKQKSKTKPYKLHLQAQEQYHILNFPFFVIFAIFGFFSFFKANLCSVDRFFSSIPFYYVMLAQFVQKMKKRKWTFLVLMAMFLSRYNFNLFAYVALWMPA